MKKISDKYLHHSIRDEEMILSILRDRQLSGTADVIGLYENALSSYFGSKHAVAVSSGSTAIQAALWCAGVRPGDEVLVPAPASFTLRSTISGLQTSLFSLNTKL